MKTKRMRVSIGTAATATLVLTLASFALSASFAGGGAFPQNILTKVRRSLNPVFQLRSEKRNYEIGTATHIKVKSRGVDISVERNDSQSEIRLSVFLEGRFAQENKKPLEVRVGETEVQIELEESLRRRAWLSTLTGEVRGNSLKLVLPRNFTGVIEIENDFGSVELTGVSLGELIWRSVSGSLFVTSSVIHVARLESISGDVDYTGVTPELQASLTSGDAQVALSDIEQSLGSKIDVISTSGNVSVAVPEFSSLRFSLSTITGAVKSDYKLGRSRDRVEGQSFEGQIGKGAGELRLRSVSGSVLLTKNIIRNPGP